jgi:hypothetical protein
VGGHGVERREIVRYIGIAPVAATFPGFQRWTFACLLEHSQPTSSRAGPDSHQPLFFSPQHYRMVEHLAELIIPEDDPPGADNFKKGVHQRA